MPALQAARGRFKTELDPGKGAIETGETVESRDHTGRPIRVPVYRERKAQTKLIPVVDPTTKQPVPKMNSANKPMGGWETQRVYITDPEDSELPNPAKVEGFVEFDLSTTSAGHEAIFLVREYIVVDMGNGGVAKNYAFRPSKAEGLRKEAEAKRQKALEAIGSLDPDKLARLVDALAGDE